MRKENYTGQTGNFVVDYGTRWNGWRGGKFCFDINLLLGKATKPHMNQPFKYTVHTCYRLQHVLYLRMI